MTVRGPSLGPLCPHPPAYPPLFFFFLQPTYHDFIGLRGAGKGVGAGSGERARFWRPFEMFSIIIFKKVCFVGSGLKNSSYLPPSP